jgi:Tol biopolymer transport system component
MTVSDPPRPPAPARTAPDSKPLEREEIEALVQALIEEARRETRRRRRRYWAVAALLAVVGVAVLILLERGAASEPASPAPPARSGAAGGRPSSKIAFLRSVGRFRLPSWYEIYVINPDGSGKRRLVRHALLYKLYDLAWSPDRRKLLFAAHLGRSAQPCDKGGPCNKEIFVINADGSGLRRLTRNAGADLEPAWSPDGQKIAWTSKGHSTGTDVFVMNADGSDQQNLTPKPGNPRGPRWSPDGQAILFTAVPPGQPQPATRWGVPYRDVYVMNADASAQRNLTYTPKAVESDPAWSPDGQQIAFSRLTGPPWEVRIVVMNADGSGKHAVTQKLRVFGDATGTTIGWSPDGRTIAFDDHDAIYLVNADGSDLRRLAENAAFQSWSPDGRKLLFARPSHPTCPPPRDTPPLPTCQAADLWVMNADGSGQRNLTRDGRGGEAATWAR